MSCHQDCQVDMVGRGADFMSVITPPLPQYTWLRTAPRGNIKQPWLVKGRQGPGLTPTSCSVSVSWIHPVWKCWFHSSTLTG